MPGTCSCASQSCGRSSAYFRAGYASSILVTRSAESCKLAAGIRLALRSC